jgi:hypothetical protein
MKGNSVRRYSILAAGLAASGLAGCSVQEARIAVPAHLAADPERIEVTGMGGGTGGRFQVAGVPGRFSRGAERLGIADPLLVRHRGGGSFQIPQSHLGPQMSGRCTYGEQQVNAGPIKVTPHRLVYWCDLSRDGRPEGRLVLQDPNAPLGSLSGRSEREGPFDYRGRQLVVRSIHRSQGRSLPLQTPLGYMFIADGREVGAVDLNGPNKTIMAPRAGEHREAVIAAGLALSIFWDPAEVQDDY